jgi:hypothetical protein
VNFVRKLNKIWGEIELSPLLKSQVKVGFVVLDLYEHAYGSMEPTSNSPRYHDRTWSGQRADGR